MAKAPLPKIFSIVCAFGRIFSKADLAPTIATDGILRNSFWPIIVNTGGGSDIKKSCLHL